MIVGDGDVDLDVDLRVYNEEGILQPLLSDFDFFTLTRTGVLDNNMVATNAIVSTEGWKPGKYRIELFARDGISGKRKTASKDIELRARTI